MLHDKESCGVFVCLQIKAIPSYISGDKRCRYLLSNRRCVKRMVLKDTDRIFGEVLKATMWF